MSTTVDVYKVKPAFSDERGDIFDLVEANVGHTGLITSVQGTVRANHYHLQSTQYTYVLTGELELRTKPINSNQEVQVDRMTPGMMAIIPPNVIHTVIAKSDCSFIDCTTLTRTGDGYEADTVRVDPI